VHFALRVDVTRNGEASYATLVGGAQADATAAGAAGLARSLLNREVAEPGAWMPEQVIDPAGFFSRLAERGVNVALAPDERAENERRDCGATPHI